MAKKKSEDQAVSTQPTMLQLMAQARQQNEVLIEREGELTPELEKEIELTQDNISKKVDGYYFRLEDIDSQIELLKKIKKQADTGIKTLTRSYDFLSQRMFNALTEFGMKQVLGNYSKFTLVKTKAKVVVENEDLLPAKYIREVVNVSIDLEQLYSDLSKGEQVPGAKLIENQYLKSSANNMKTVKGEDSNV